MMSNDLQYFDVLNPVETGTETSQGYGPAVFHCLFESSQRLVWIPGPFDRSRRVALPLSSGRRVRGRKTLGRL